MTMIEKMRKQRLLKSVLSGQRWRALTAWRARVAVRVASAWLGRPVQISARQSVSLAGAVVLWYLDDGVKHFVMVRTPMAAKDGANEVGKEAAAIGNTGATGAAVLGEQARFVSCLGMGPHESLNVAVANLVDAQLGSVFAKTLPGDAFDADRVASAPMFAFTDDELGSRTMVQTLVWLVQVVDSQIDLIEPAKGLQVVIVPETAMNSPKVSPTHGVIWQSVARHLPKGRVAFDDEHQQSADESIKDVANPLRGNSRVLH